MDNKNDSSASTSNYGIRIKLQLGFLVVLLLTLLVGGVGYHGVTKIKAGADDIGAHWLKAGSILNQVVEDTEDTRRYLLAGFLMRADAQAFQNYKGIFNNLVTKWENDFADYNQYVTSEDGKARSKAMLKAFKLYTADANQVWQLAEQGKDAEARPVLTQKSKDSFDLVINSMNAQMEFMASGGAQAVKDAQATNNFVIWLLAIFVVLSLIAGSVIAILLAQHISRPLAEVTRVAQSIAEGDLKIKIPNIKNRDEIGVLSRAVGEMVNFLRDLVGEILTESDNMAATSQELSAASEEATAASNQISESISQLASGASNQAISVGNTSSIIEQLSVNAQQVAENAEIVSQSSEKAAKAAEVGAHQADNAVQKIATIQEVSIQTGEAVFRLGDQSKQIGQIVDVIKGIAEQTNLLALNAAIEAARAGEQGKGFAVVAEEVRKLAEQSSASATQIASLIDNIQHETERAVEMMEIGKGDVAAGVEAVDLAGNSFRTIVQEVNTVAEQILQVSEAVHQMAAGAAQAVKSMGGIGVIAEETAASTEEVSAASQEQAATMQMVSQSAETLAKLGESLKSAVIKFKV